MIGQQHLPCDDAMWGVQCGRPVFRSNRIFVFPRSRQMHQANQSVVPGGRVNSRFEDSPRRRSSGDNLSGGAAGRALQVIS